MREVLDRQRQAAASRHRSSRAPRSLAICRWQRRTRGSRIIIGWFDDRVAPDFARCVDIHRKPGYDPVELFLDPKIPAVKLKIMRKLLQKKLGFRMLMDVIPLDATLVKGSHGCVARRTRRIIRL